MDEKTLKNIKLIIWDLDNTFWSGTLSENETVTPIPQNISLVKNLAERGIISSIVSKNDKDEAISKLKEYDVDSFFVFSSINWDSKGLRIKQLLNNINIREENALFIDDNPSNLAEAKSYNPHINVSSPDVIDFLIKNSLHIGKDDKSLSRLQQYKELEHKHYEQTKYKDVDSFLRNSNICISIDYDCIKVFDRLHELITRTNQLNYTKKRWDLNTLKHYLESPIYKNGYVTCKDKYSFYGIVGFFSLNMNTNVLEQLCFSCRTMGMNLESFIYNYLGNPSIDVIEPVSKQLLVNKKIDYISIKKSLNKKQKKSPRKFNMCVRGPCDLDALCYYLKDHNIHKELAYVGTHNVSLFQIGHSQVLKDSYDYEPLGIPFVEDEMYKTTLYNHYYDLIVFSVLTEAQYGLYSNKKNKRCFVYGETTRKADFYSQNKDFEQGFKNLNKDDYRTLDDYDFLGRITVKQSIANYQFVVDHLPKKTLVCFLLGPENNKSREDNRSLLDNSISFYCKLNAELINKFRNRHNVRFIKPQIDDYDNRFFNYNSNTHYSRKTYYLMAKEIVNIAKRNIKINKVSRIKDCLKK